MGFSRAADKRNIIEGYTHQDLADILGACRETTNQILNDFIGKVWIEIGLKRIDIRSPRWLEMISLE